MPEQKLFSGSARVSDEGQIEDLKSALIASFETALDKGLSPQKAIAAILKWASEECARLESAKLN